MRAMILAAGRGERMRPLTDSTPKPLLEVNGKPLIVYHLERFHDAGITEVVINHGRLGHLIETALGNGDQLGMRIQYSAEGDTPLETGGGIVKALPLLGDQPFIALNADIWTDFDCKLLPQTLDSLAHLVLVNNPDHNAKGDFALNGGLLRNEGENKLTFSGIGIYQPAMFQGREAGRFSLTPLLREKMNNGQVSGQYYQGVWRDIGTPERLSEIQASQHQ